MEALYPGRGHKVESETHRRSENGSRVPRGLGFFTLPPTGSRNLDLVRETALGTKYNITFWEKMVYDVIIVVLGA